MKGDTLGVQAPWAGMVADGPSHMNATLAIWRFTGPGTGPT